MKTTVKTFTLIEVLVTLTLFTLLISISSIALSHFENQYQIIKKQTLHNTSEFKQWLLLNDSLEAANDYYIKQYINQEEKHRPLFSGTQDSLTWITLRPFFGSQGAALCQLNVEIEKQQLLYSEVPLEKSFLDSQNEIDDLLKNAQTVYWSLEEQTCTFSYTAAGSSIQFLSNNNKVSTFTTYESKTKMKLPKTVNIHFNKNGNTTTRVFHLPEGNPEKTNAYLLFREL